MESNYLIVSCNVLAEMRMRIEGMILLYEEDTLVLHDLAAKRKLYHAVGALDAIATVLYDMRKQIIDLQAAYRKEVALQSEIYLDE